MPSTYFDSPTRDWRQLCGEFRWGIPDKFNIAHACCGRWASERSRFALYAVDNENCRAWSFWDIQQAANRLSNTLAAMTVMAGDCVAIIMGQRAETAIAHIACHQMGALTLPLSPHIGAKELADRLQRTPARIVVIDEDALSALESIGPSNYAKYVIGVGAARASRLRRWDDLLPLASSNYTALATFATAPAIVGAQGDLLPQRSLLAQLPGFVCAHEFYPQNADLFWSPRTWTLPGLFGGILPAWYFGQPVLAYRGPLDAERAYRLMNCYGVKNFSLDEEMLTAMQSAPESLRNEFDIAVRTLTTPTDRSDESSLAWAQRTFRTTPNVVGGTEEIPHLFGSCGSLRANPPGALGYAFPGHTLAVLDSQRQPCTNGISGELSLQEHYADSAHPGLPIACHNAPHADNSSDWRPTGIHAHMDDERIIWPPPIDSN